MKTFVEYIEEAKIAGLLPPAKPSALKKRTAADAKRAEGIEVQKKRDAQVKDALYKSKLNKPKTSREAADSVRKKRSNSKAAVSKRAALKKLAADNKEKKRKEMIGKAKDVAGKAKDVAGNALNAVAGGIASTHKKGGSNVGGDGASINSPHTTRES